MTRRLEPMDRVRELGDASVPFPFDVHALYFSDDAVTLENELHPPSPSAGSTRSTRAASSSSPTPPRSATSSATKVGNLLEFTDNPEATQYFQSRSAWPDSNRSSAPMQTSG